MADAYGDNDLRRLEREAENARARLHNTIAEIKDPQTIENAKLEMKHRAEEMKDQIIGYVTGARDKALDSGRAQGSEFTRKLQRTAIENPLSVALIGAGIGWHLYKKPPITTVLIGAGIWQMMKGWNGAPDDRAYRDPYNRTSPRGYVPGGVAGYGYDEVTDIASATERVRTVATNLTYEAQSAVAGVQDAITGAAERVRETVSEGVDQVRGAVSSGSGARQAQPADQMTNLGASMADRAGEQYQHAAERMQDMAEHATERMQDMAGEAQRRMGDMAGQAQRRMSGMADEAQRRMQPVIDRVSPYLDAEHRSQLGMALVLGGIGVLAGGMLRNSEMGRRFMDEARERASDSWESMRDMTRDMPRRVSTDEWRDRASGAMSRMSDQASSTMSRMSEQADTFRRSAMESAGQMRERSADYMRSAQEMGSEHPLLLSAIGLAIGAVLGGMIRQTPFERETFGPMAKNLRDTAVDTLQTNMENVAERASNVAQAVVETVTGGDNDDPAKKAQAQRDRVNA